MKLMQQQAFTIIELMLSIGIIGTIAGIVIAAINPSAQLSSAQRAKRQSEMREFKNSIVQYTIETGGYFNTNLTIPPGDNRFDGLPICAYNAADTTYCVDLDNLIDDGYIVSFPENQDEPIEDWSGYRVYQDAGGFIGIGYTDYDLRGAAGSSRYSGPITLNGSNPYDGQTNWQNAYAFELDFNKGVRGGAGYVYIYRSSDDVLIERFAAPDTVAYDEDDISGSLVEYNNRAYFRPSSPLQSGVDYYILIDGNAYYNGTYNFRGIYDKTELNFRMN